MSKRRPSADARARVAHRVAPGSTKWIVPGKGLGKVRLGADMTEVIKILGKPIVKATFAVEDASWRTGGYVTREQMMFELGFDYMYEFKQVSTSPYYPVWKVYARKGKAVFITLTTFSTKKAITQRMGLSPRCRFYDRKKAMIDVLGPAYVFHRTKRGNLNHYYMSRGINVILDSGLVRVFEIFPPLSKRRAHAFVVKLKQHPPPRP